MKWIKTRNWIKKRIVVILGMELILLTVFCYAIGTETTAYNRKLIKSNVLIMGENKAAGEVRYIHGEYGKGTWSFLGGHDPEDYQHFVGDPVTELDLHRQSAGYRLILNNILFPAARKKQHKT